tara:strand:+ start:1041 stop:1988 length:948 start_codon:yes stop_codon:yes gene_type:complete
MPLKQLKTYNGTNPKPLDFDSFWERKLYEVNKIDPEITIQPSEFKTSFANCFDLYFTSTKNARIHAKLIHPKKNVQPPHPAVIMFHGYAGDAGDWSEKLAFAAEGFTVAALDCRGQGGSSEDVGGTEGGTMRGHIIRGLEGSADDMLFTQIFLDTVLLTKIVMGMESVDAKRIGVTGSSQGGGLTLACASLVPEIKLVAPVYPFLSDYKRVWEIDQAKDAYFELQDYFKKFDPLHLKEDEVFTKLGYIDIQNLTPRIKGEVMIAIGLMDTICPPSTQFAAYNKITSRKKHVLYPDFGHEKLPGFPDTIFEFMSGL